jgi:hypothetical protein
MHYFATRRWVLHVLYIAGLTYAGTVGLVLMEQVRLDTNNRLRFGLWLFGAVLLALVVLRWWVTAILSEAKGANTAAIPVRVDERPWLERVMAWFFAYPLFPLQIAAFCAISWLGLGAGLGLPDLLWDDNWVWRFINGLCVSLLFANVLTIRFLLDQRPDAPPPRTFWPNRAPQWLRNWSLFWFDRRKDSVVRKLGTFLLWLWLPALALFYFPKMWSPDWKELNSGAMLAGLLVGIILYVGWARWLHNELNRQGEDAPVRGKIYLGLSNRLQWFFDLFPVYRTAPQDLQQLINMAGRLVMLPLFALVIVVVASLIGVVWSPIWIACLILGLCNHFFGVLTYHFAGLQYILISLAVLIVVVCNTQHPDKMSFPGLEKVDQVNLDTLYPENEALNAEVKALNLVQTPEMLRNFHTKWTSQSQDGKSRSGKPKLVIVATSGGGIRAAVWTAVVLEELEEYPELKKAGFRDHIRLMTGASGGMLGAGLYAADFETTTRETKQSALLAEDSLWPTIQTMMLHDLPAIGVPWNLDIDRGRRLEARWVQNTRAGGRSPLEKTFKELNSPHSGGAGAEQRCERPSLVFSPMLVEDCRRLLITNLDFGGRGNLEYAALNPAVSYHLPSGVHELPRERQSVPVVEFWRAFPTAYDKFQIKTAARMSATFPFVGPAVNLPTNPRRRVVDAGYFDNFGINLAAVWLYRYKSEILAHTSGVVIVEIRAYPRRAEKLLAEPRSLVKDPNKPVAPVRPEMITWALSELSTPAEALSNLYAKGAYFRNDILLDFLDKEFNGVSAAKKSPWEKFFTTVAFECDQDAALSWTLPERDYRRIRESFASSLPAVEALAKWYGPGGD